MSVNKFAFSGEKIKNFIFGHFDRRVKIGIGIIIFLQILILIFTEASDTIGSCWDNIRDSIEEISSQRSTRILNEKNDSGNVRIELSEVHSETSPDGLREIILYKRPFIGESDREYSNYLNNQYLFVVREFDHWIEREVYIGDYKVGTPHWLGNDFIFFTGGCGTGCRGFYLVNINSRQSYNGVITTTPVSRDGFITHLRDWFDHQFEFTGYDENIRSVYLNGKIYLIFEMWNNKKYIGEKRFLFTGQNLIEQ